MCGFFEEGEFCADVDEGVDEDGYGVLFWGCEVWAC